MRFSFRSAKILLALVPTAVWAQAPVTKPLVPIGPYKILWQNDPHKCTYVAVFSPKDPVGTIMGRNSFTVYVDKQTPGYEPNDIQALHFSLFPPQNYIFVSKTNTVAGEKVVAKFTTVMNAFQTACQAIQTAVKNKTQPDLTTPPTRSFNSFVSVSKSGAIVVITLPPPGP